MGTKFLYSDFILEAWLLKIKSIELNSKQRAVFLVIYYWHCKLRFMCRDEILFFRWQILVCLLSRFFELIHDFLVE